MGLEGAPKERMVGVDFDPPPQLARDLLFVLHGLDHPRHGRTREAQEQDRLTRTQPVPGNVGRLKNRDRGFAGAGPSRDKEVAVCGHDLPLPFTELHPPAPPARRSQLQRRLLPRYSRAQACTPPPDSCRRSAAIRGSHPPHIARENRRCPSSPSSTRNIRPAPHRPRLPAAGTSPADAGANPEAARSASAPHRSCSLELSPQSPFPDASA